MIGCRERTFDEILEAYMNPTPSPDQWDLDCLMDKVKEATYRLIDYTPVHLAGLLMEELKTFLQNQLYNTYQFTEGKIEQMLPAPLREAERLFIPHQINSIWCEQLQAIEALSELIGLCGYWQKNPLIEHENKVYVPLLEAMRQIQRNSTSLVLIFHPGVNPPQALAQTL